MQVHRHVVMQALQWLQLNNPYYSNITIDDHAIQRLPVNGIPDDLQSIDDDD